jgi:hypothetical protein
MTQKFNRFGLPPNAILATTRATSPLLSTAGLLRGSLLDLVCGLHWEEAEPQRLLKLKWEGWNMAKSGKKLVPAKKLEKKQTLRWKP